eukprot:TRINITY_DN74156_c0_g1_i1.p1 TRINITY_DN74156_c0_g1~~TRINITY_DN74156_c0_g1_i1.p1  ORF type:complete len:512 (+),score=136.94 TRINITY_DN74156_c0_g1_i1:89-1537(+)
MGRFASFRACVLAYALLQGTLAAPKKKKGDEDSTKVPMPRHSFANPMLYQSLLDDWMVSGASIFERERLLMHPAVSERSGFAFSKLPVNTNNFEVRISFRVAGEQSPEKFLTDQSLAVWYVEDNVSASYREDAIIKASSWKEGMEAQGLTFSGGPAKFKGFSAVLSTTDATQKLKPVVSFVSNDGTKSLAMGTDAPTAKAKAIDFRNTLNPAQFKLRVTPEFVEGHLKQSPSLSWNECFRIDRSDGSVPVPAKGYFGITAWSGTPAEGAASDLVSIIQVEMTNYDDTVVAEDMKDVSVKIQDAYREMLTDENRHFIDQKSQMDHLNRLRTMLTDHLEEVLPVEKRLFEDLQGFDLRLNRLDEDCRTLSKEFEILVNPAGGAGVGAVKDGIVGLRQLLQKDSVAHKEKLERVTNKLADVRSSQSKVGDKSLNVISLQADALNKTVTLKSLQMNWLLFVLIGCVLLIGGLMWNRMHYYEKRHFT